MDATTFIVNHGAVLSTAKFRVGNGEVTGYFGWVLTQHPATKLLTTLVVQGPHAGRVVHVRSSCLELSRDFVRSVPNR